MEKEPSSFSSFIAVRCNACARPAAAAAALPSVLPQVSESSQSRMPDSVPSQHRRGHKRTAEVALDTTAETAHHDPAAPSAVVIPVKGKKRGPKPKRPWPTESGNLEKPVGSVDRESQFVASTSRADIMTPVGNARPNTISGPVSNRFPLTNIKSNHQIKSNQIKSPISNQIINSNDNASQNNNQFTFFVPRYNTFHPVCFCLPAYFRTRM